MLMSSMPIALKRSSATDDTFRPEPGDGLASVAQDLGQDRFGVLAEGRGGRRLPDLAVGPDGARDLPDAAELRVIDLDDHVARAHLLVFERLGHGVHGRAGDMPAQETQPLGRGLLHEARLEDGDQLRLVGEALREAGEAGVLSELR
jgi:hypothetical protein